MASPTGGGFLNFLQCIDYKATWNMPSSYFLIKPYLLGLVPEYIAFFNL